MYILNFLYTNRKQKNVLLAAIGQLHCRCVHRVISEALAGGWFDTENCLLMLQFCECFM